ncbi:hypothetical protein KR093_004264, partial [Drosophila rubida]
SRDDLAKQLRGTRKDAECAVEIIQKQFSQLRNGGKSSVVAFVLRILRQLCCAMQDNNHKNADVYCNIAASLMHHVEPVAAKPEYWVNYLTSLQYIHHALCQEQTMAECQRFYAMVNAQSVQLPTKSDYKFYMNMHIRHIYFYGQQLQKPATATKEAKEQVCLGMLAMGTLFQTMQLQHDASYNELMGEFNQILGKRSGNFLKVFGSLPLAYTNKMFDPLFKLISCNGGSADELSKQLPDYLTAVQALIQLDGFTWQQKAAALQKPLVVRLLQSLRELYKELQLQNYTFQLLYYYLKLIFKREADGSQKADVQQQYLDLVKNWKLFLESKCAAHAQDQWFIDVLVLLVRLQKQMHQPDGKAPCFEVFWQLLSGDNSAEAYGAHFELLQCLMNTSRSISGKSSLTPTCTNEPACQSIRKHCIVSLGCCAIAAYSNWQPTAQATLSKAAQKCLAENFNYAVDVLKLTTCMRPTSAELVNLTWHLTNIADKATSPAQIELLQRLFKPLQKLRLMIDTQAMRQLLRRIYKASALCKQPTLEAQIQSAYIAAINCPARQFQQMCIYYRSNSLSTCLYELHEQSPLSSPFNAEEKRKFYELDMLTVLGNKKTPDLLQSLLRYRHTDYHLALLGRQLRADRKILKQFEELQVKLLRLGQKQQLTRLEQLVLGHVSVGKLLDALERQKIKISIKDTAEKCLEELFRHNMLHVNIMGELTTLELATTAVDAFAAFFNRADSEPLSSDEALIDWEALMEDLVVVAMSLSTMGYTQQADAAWLLLLRISRLLGDRFTFLRAVSHFMASYTQHPLVELPAEVAHAQLLLDELWPQLHSSTTYFKREHSILMLCLCHMALYYARLDNMCHAQLLLHHAEQLRSQFLERAGKCDIVQLTLQSVRFRISYQQQRSSQLLGRLPTALQQLDTLADSVRNFSSVSSVDHGALVLLLADLVRDSTECTANRLSELPNFSSSLLQVLLQSGMVLRAVEVLISWLWTNVRMECLEKALSKLRLIEHFLCIQPLSSKRQASQCKAKDLVDAPLLGQSKLVEQLEGQLGSLQLEQFVEPMRKQLPQHTTVDSHLTLQRYLDQAQPMMRKSLKLQCVYFTVGCLHARFYFLNREHEQLDNFYTTATSWLQGDKQRCDAVTPQTLLVLKMYQANYLRLKHKHNEAIKITEEALRLANSEQLRHCIDINYRNNLQLQLRSAQRELQPQPVARRALQFVISPEEKHKASAASKKSPKFAIYTDDSEPLSDGSSSSSSGPEKHKRQDLNSCQIIEVIESSDEEPIAAPKPTRSTRTRSKQPTATTSRRNASATRNRAVPSDEVAEVASKTRTRGRAKR